MIVQPVHVVETIDAVKGKEEVLQNALLSLVSTSRLEKGCIDYSLYRDEDHPYRFIVLMQWETREDYQQHTVSPVIVDFVKKFENTTYTNVVEIICKEVP